MSGNMDSDAALLWQDVLVLLHERDMEASTLAMVESCTPLSLEDDRLRISCSLSFAQRKIMQSADIIEECLEEAAFQPLKLSVELVKERRLVRPSSRVTTEEYERLSNHQETPAPSPATVDSSPLPAEDPMDDATHQLLEQPPDIDSKLTFDRFVVGEENRYALEAAKQVANGDSTSYNPLFIYGKSGLGKTHLLRAIQNYITSNDPSRRCLYRAAADFVDDYVMAANDRNNTSATSALTARYGNVDVLIIDDVQNMTTAAGTIRFFFKTFNSLMSRGKQIVLAADRSPSQLGMGDSKFDERDTSRMDSGLSVSIQVPDYELKLNLIEAFYERMRADAENEHINGVAGSISEENRRLMAERAGTNIRVIEGFVQSCLMQANRRERAGLELTRDDIIDIAQQKWPTGQHIVTVEQIQKRIESFYDVSHIDLIGAKRKKDIMEARHVAIWLTRALTDNTLADIGKKFGGRTHATVKHSIAWVDDLKHDDRLFHDRVEMLKDSIVDTS